MHTRNKKIIPGTRHARKKRDGPRLEGKEKVYEFYRSKVQLLGLF